MHGIVRPRRVLSINSLSMLHAAQSHLFDSSKQTLELYSWKERVFPPAERKTKFENDKSLVTPLLFAAFREILPKAGTDEAKVLKETNPELKGNMSGDAIKSLVQVQ